jgi:iron complex transport system ATP-binding protein
LLSLVKDLARKQKLAVLMALHDLNLVSFYADKAALIVRGRIQKMGQPRQVIRAEHISAAYQTPVDIVPHPVTGASLIFPHGVLDQRHNEVDQ